MSHTIIYLRCRDGAPNKRTQIWPSQLHLRRPSGVHYRRDVNECPAKKRGVPSSPRLVRDDVASRGFTGHVEALPGARVALASEVRED